MKGLNHWQTEGVTKTATPSLLIWKVLKVRRVTVLVTPPDKTLFNSHLCSSLIPTRRGVQNGHPLPYHFSDKTVLQRKLLVHKGVVETTTPCLSSIHRGSPKRRPPACFLCDIKIQARIKQTLCCRPRLFRCIQV